jgi:lysophospholipid acyltransferase (LPLAT)-like uncharacterized protein
LNSLLASCRIERDGVENYESFWRCGRPVVFVLWHGRLLPCTYRHRGQRLVTLISRHRDGDYITHVVERWGYHAVRGSSSQGGADALRQLVRSVRSGRSIAVTPDGPRGPREQMKMGPLSIAQLTGAPLIPVASGASRAWYFGGWDRFLVPKPFARLRIRYSEPIIVPRDADPVLLEALRMETELRLQALTRQVDLEVGAR